MNSRSLARLAALTQGAALIGAGVVACAGNSSPATDPSATPPSAFTLTTIPGLDAAVAPDMSYVDDAATVTDAVDAAPSGIVDAGPGPITEDVPAAVDAGTKRHHFPTPNAVPRHGDAGPKF